MKKIVFTTYWSPEEAQGILLFLDELRETLLAHYGDDIANYHRECQQENKAVDFDVEDDIIHF